MKKLIMITKMLIKLERSESSAREVFLETYYFSDGSIEEKRMYGNTHIFRSLF